MPSRQQKGILMVSKTIRNEVIDVIYSQTIFSIQISPGNQIYRPFYSIEKINRIQNLEIIFEVSVLHRFRPLAMEHTLRAVKSICTAAINPFHGNDVFRRSCTIIIPAGVHFELRVFASYWPCLANALRGLNGFQRVLLETIYPSHAELSFGESTSSKIDFFCSQLEGSLGPGRKYKVEKGNKDQDRNSRNCLEFYPRAHSTMASANAGLAEKGIHVLMDAMNVGGSPETALASLLLDQEQIGK